MWLNTGDRIQNQSGWLGVVTAEDGDFVTVDFDNGQRGVRFARDGDGVLELLDFGSEIESNMGTLRPGDLPDYQLKHPLDRWPVIDGEPNEDGPLLDDDGNPWSNL